MDNNIQFGRFAEVEIRDFNSQTKTIIGNEFEIDFEYFKTIDQTQEDDSGTIRIYGLTDERVKSLQTEGGEVRLRCGYIGSQIDTLIIASISSLYTQKVNNTTMTTINCSANLMNHYITDSFSNNGGALSVIGLVANISKSMGYDSLDVDLSSVSDEDYKKVEDYLSTAKTNFAIVGSLTDSIKTLSEQVGFSWRKISGVKVVITPNSEGVKRILDMESVGYAKINSNTNTRDNSVNFLNSLEADSKDTKTFILNHLTGLISSNKEYKISYAYADQAVSDSGDVVVPANTVITKPTQNNKNPEDNPFVSNAALSGLKIKDSSATDNGGVRRHTAGFANLVSNFFGYDIINYFSSFNDKFHSNRGGRHPDGRAFDFTLKNPSKKLAAQITQEVRDLARQQGYEVKMLDEYNYPSKGSTGGHIHVSVIGLGNVANYKPTYQVGSDGALVKRVTIATNLEYRRVKALLNPMVLPQTQVAILESIEKDTRNFSAKSDSVQGIDGVTEEVYKVCRVRSAAYSGNNKDNEWIMELYCEDTDSKLVDEKETQRILATNPDDSINIVEAIEPKEDKKSKKESDKDE